jgi:hypothetical protein
MQIDSELPGRQAISEAEHRRLGKILMNRSAPFCSTGMPIYETAPHDGLDFGFMGGRNFGAR